MERHCVCNDQPAKRMSDAFRSGNGTLLLLDYGDPFCNKLTLSHEELYTPQWEEPPKAPLLREVLPEIQNLLLAGEYQKSPCERGWRIQYNGKSGCTRMGDHG